MKTVRNSQYAMPNAQYAVRNVRWMIYCALCIAYCALGCAPQPTDSEEFSFTPIPRLARYYPVVNDNGDTTFETPQFETFVSQNGDSFSTASLKGNIVVVQIFFASCKGICPVISHGMQSVQQEFHNEKNVKLVSISVDPARDSFQVLKEYAHQMSADSTKWTFLTGDKKKTYDLIRYGYRLPDIEPGNGGEEDFIHSDQLVLIDRNNVIRGYYGGTDTAQIRMLKEDVHTLLSQQ